MRYVTAVFAFALFVSAHAPAAPRVLQPRDLFNMQWAGDPQITADGARVAYIRTANDIMTDGQVDSLWMIDAATGTESPLAGAPGHYSSPRWSPDGKELAYVSRDAHGQAQILVHWMQGQTAVLTNLQQAPTDITWSPDGQWIAFLMREPTPPPAIGKPLAKPAGAKWAPGPVVIDRLNYHADGQGLDKPGYRHLYVVPVAGGGEPRQLTFGSFSDAGPLAWSPDGRWIYFASNHNPDWQREPEDWARHTAMILSIFRVGVADGSLTQLSHAVGPYSAPVVSPDGKLIAFLGYKDRHVGAQDMRLNVMDADGGHAREVSDSLDRSIDEARWAADGRSLYVEYVDHGIARVARMGLDGRVHPIASDLAAIDGTSQLPYSSGGEFTVSGNGTVAYSGGGPDHLPEVYVAGGGRTRRLTHLDAGLLSSVKLAKLVSLPVRSSFDGRAIDAWELLPPDYQPGRKYPLILEIHGGPYASYAPVFSADLQLYAAAGYIVVYGNPRGSTSYGEAFGNLIYDNYPSHDYDDLMSVVDAAIQRGNVDANNLFVTGSSGGGVLTAWIVGKTHRFRAAVSQRPVVNWTSWLLMTDMGAFGARYWFRHMPWEDQQTYWKHSPLSLVGNVTTPTMVVVGLKDLRTTVGEAEQYYQALQLRHIPTELYEIPGAAHVRLQPSQLAQQSTAIVAWFNRYRTAASR